MPPTLLPHFSDVAFLLATPVRVRATVVWMRYGCLVAHAPYFLRAPAARIAA